MRPWPPAPDPRHMKRQSLSRTAKIAGHIERVTATPCPCDPVRSHGPHYVPVRRSES